MSTESISKTEITSSNIPERAKRLAWVGLPPLFKGEDVAAYEELSARTDGAVKPADIFEEIWAGDFINNEWDVLRYRRQLASLMTSTAYEGLEKILEPLVELYPQRIDLARAWAARDKAAIKRVDELLASAGLTMDAVTAQTFCTYLDEFERTARMIASAEARRDNALHEIERHRAQWGQELWRVAQEAEKTLEMEAIEDKSGKTSN